MRRNHLPPETEIQLIEAQGQALERLQSFHVAEICKYTLIRFVPQHRNPGFSLRARPNVDSASQIAGAASAGETHQCIDRLEVTGKRVTEPRPRLAGCTL